MTLSQDLEHVLALAGMDAGDVGALIADGDGRSRAYLAALAAAPAAREGELVTIIQRDPDRVMAEATLVRHVDNQAAARSADSFAAWAATFADLVGQQGFLGRRVGEWRLFKRVMDGDEVDPAALGSASNWLQRKIVEEATSGPALTAMGEVGRTKRLRNLARTRAGRVGRA